jgi:hypothetical protein
VVGLRWLASSLDGCSSRPGRCCQFNQGDAPLATDSIQARTHFGQDGG